jgi:hypothetical protein
MLDIERIDQPRQMGDPSRNPSHQAATNDREIRVRQHFLGNDTRTVA